MVGETGREREMGEFVNNELDNMVSNYYNSGAAEFDFDSSSDSDDALLHDEDDDSFCFEQVNNLISIFFLGIFTCVFFSLQTTFFL